MIKAMFFDLYGTLAGFKPSRFEIQSRVAAEFGVKLTPEGVLKGYALADTYMAKQNTQKPLGEMSNRERNMFFAEYEKLVLSGSGYQVTTEKAKEIWSQVRQQEYSLVPFADVKPVLSVLKDSGLALGLISNMGRDGQDLLDELELDEHLDFAVTSLEVGVAKPDARIFYTALNYAQVQPDQALHVGDQISSDIEGARRVGIMPILMDRDRNHVDFNSCPRIESLTELSSVIT